MFLQAAVPILLAGALAAETHTIVPKQYFRTFSRSHQVLLKIKPGDRVITKTIDGAGRDFENAVRSEPSNPLTGPFYIEGAEPGDAIRVRFERVRLNRNSGWSTYRLGLFSLTPEYVENVYSNSYREGAAVPGRSNLVPWEIDLAKNIVRLREPKSARYAFEFPARPMLGCVGVAPAGDFAPTSAPSGAYGGNLDYNRIAEGSVVILPVSHPGALLFIGDGHALQADGEPTGTGIETSLDVEFTVEVQKNARVTGPRVETADHIISIGSQAEFQSSLDRALQLATTDMARWLVNSYGLEPWAAHLLIGYQGEYDVITVQGSMGLRLPKRVLPQRQ